ncbi:hypothetical protein BCR39DRAFT_600899 [Naematelia encephala]|uniref:Uncharacterized protein n=1 Tax=Naematelia encephala TaxID=71784 RepID=A0A1Y2AKN5_9TREE|nr:hypothetical protein BCR39DRAFT_600899 [Naematelia encephala]
MAYKLRCGVRAPIENGWTLGPDLARKQFEFVAYLRPDGDSTYFSARSNGTWHREGDLSLWVHTGMVSTLTLTVKLWVIPEAEANRLRDLELVWWRDYDQAVAEGKSEEEAAARAHWMVSRQKRMPRGLHFTLDDRYRCIYVTKSSREFPSIVSNADVEHDRIHFVINLEPMFLITS